VGAAEFLEDCFFNLAPCCGNGLGTDYRTDCRGCLSFVRWATSRWLRCFGTAASALGGVIAFIYADLIVLPIINICRKYYGWKATAFVVGIFYLAMAVSALIIEFVFRILRSVPQERKAQVVEASISFNYTTVLNIIFLMVAGFLVIRFLKTGGPKMLEHMD
jgi:uncharacterized membrane protein YraQ (UPF0718 family)